MNEIMVNSIMDYFKLEKTNYAILINGEWGTGKTYFWSNFLVPKIKKEICDQGEKKVIYISLNGIEQINEIKEKIFVENMFEKSKFSKNLQENKLIKKSVDVLKFGIGIAKDLTPYLKDIKGANINLDNWIDEKNLIICFDDLERCKLDVDVIFGFINDFVEHKGSKVIIIANEEKLNTNEKYGDIKEKLVGQTYSYRPKTEETLKSIIESKKNTLFKKFLLEHLNFLIKIYSKSEVKSLRIFNQSLDKLESLFNNLNVNENINDFTKNVFAFTFSYALELKANRDKNGMFKKISTNLQFQSELWEVAFKISDNKGNALEIDTFAMDFSEKYFENQENDEPFFLKSIEVFVREGIFDFEEYEREVKELMDEKNYIPPIEKRFLHYWELTDEEFVEFLPIVYDMSINGEISTKAYFKYYRVFLELAKSGLFDKTQEEIKLEMINGIRKSSIQSEMTEESSLDYNYFSDDEKDIEKDLKDLRTEIIKKVDQFNEDKKRNKILEIFTSNAYNIGKMYKLMEEHFYKEAIFYAIGSHKLIDVIDEMDTKLLRDFFIFLGKWYENFTQEQSRDLEVLEKLRVLLDKRNDKKTTSLRTNTLMKINELLLEIIQKMKN